MGVRSDVGLAIKRNAWASISADNRAKLDEVMSWVDETIENDEGFLFCWRGVKWYHETYNEIKVLYEVLSTLEHDDFTLVCATPEDPTDDTADLGDWWQNPWDLSKYATCTLEYSMK